MPYNYLIQFLKIFRSIIYYFLFLAIAEMLVTRGFINHQRFKPVRTINLRTFSIAIKQVASAVSVPNHKLYVPKPRPIATLRVLSNYNKTKAYKQPAENKYDNQYDTDSLESVVEPAFDTVIFETAPAKPTLNTKAVTSWRSRKSGAFDNNKSSTGLASLASTLSDIVIEADQPLSTRSNDNSINHSDSNNNINKAPVTSWRSRKSGVYDDSKLDPTPVSQAPTTESTLSDIIIETEQATTTDTNYNDNNQVDGIDDSTITYDNKYDNSSNDIIPEAEYYDTSTSPHTIDTETDCTSAVATQPLADTSLDLLHNEGGPSTSGGHNSDDFLKRVRIVNTIKDAEYILQILNSLADKDIIWACDTEVADIDVKTQGPVGNGHVVCVSIYGGPIVNFDGDSEGEDEGVGKALWIENLDESDGVLNIFKNWFENESIKKVWHNYGFDRHVLYNHGIDCRGFIGIVYNYYS